MAAGSRKLRVVIDTNVFISGLNFGGKPGEVLDLLIKEELPLSWFRYAFGYSTGVR